MSSGGKFNLIENYIYLYHTGTFVIIPTYPDQLQDNVGVQFNSSTVLSRSAPIYSFSNSGPRSVQINLNLHRDLMTQVNYKKSNLKVTLTDDYVDTIVKELQSIALPVYSAASKMVDPPMVAVRFGNELFCKGVVIGQVSTVYNLPILENDKYAQVSISFQLYEVDPYDATTVRQSGSFRGLQTSLERNLWKT